MGKSDDEKELESLQVGLVDAQIWAMEKGQRLLVVFEGRDTAGKDGAIKRITEFLSPRNTRVAALPKPSDRERTQWYFQRYSDHLPAAGEWVLFNRSWYNRAGVERVMNFSTPEEQERFLHDAPEFERMLVESGIRLVKFWLDISKDEQADRLKARSTDPLKRLKISPLDAVAQEKWKDYSKARNEMLRRTHTAVAPWTCVRTDDKKIARANIIRHLLQVIDCPSLSCEPGRPDPAVVFPFEPDAITDGRLFK